jgi:hypothetical protein
MSVSSSYSSRSACLSTTAAAAGGGDHSASDDDAATCAAVDATADAAQERQSDATAGSMYLAQGNTREKTASKEARK